MPMVGRDTKNAAFRRTAILANVFVGLYAIYTLIPLLYVVLSATKTERELYTTFGFWFGSGFNFFDNLTNVWRYQNGVFGRWLFNSAWYAVTSASFATLFAAAAGYAFAKFNFAGKNSVFAIILGSVMVPQTALVIPLFLLQTNFGLVNTPWAVILPTAVFPLGVFLMRIYADKGVPTELIEAARMDGAGEARIFFTIALRLMAPGLVTVLLLAFVGSWNNYFLPLVVLSSPDYLPATVGLANWYGIAVGGQTGDPFFTMVLTGSVISILPIIAVFIFLQRYLQDGLTMGSVK